MSQIPRLYVRADLLEGASLTLEEAQSHYVRHVLRLKEGARVHLFNGRDGEWEAMIDAVGKRDTVLCCTRILREQTQSPDVWLLFAPIKHGKIDFLAQKATELGISRLWPVMTQHTMVSRINTERLQANVVEAAEQSARLDLPNVIEPCDLMQALSHWDTERILLFGDESGHSAPAPEVLAPLAGRKLALLIGPEGGFSLPEHEHLRTLAFARGISMGPRVMRADTAALAALAITQAICGDWSERPGFTPLD